MTRRRGWLGALAGVMLVAACSGPSSPAPSSTPTLPNRSSSTPLLPRPSTSSHASPPGATATPTGPPRYVFPVVGTTTYAHTHHDYPATDIIAGCGLAVVAATDGVVLEVSRVDTWKASTNLGATRGGLFVSILGDDGVRYYVSHLSVIAPGLDAGSRVTAGDEIGEVGDTGDASVCHVHFGISPPCARTGDWAIRRGVVWPWPYLDSWRAGTGGSAVGAVAGWLATHSCPRN